MKPAVRPLSEWSEAAIWRAGFLAAAAVSLAALAVNAAVAEVDPAGGWGLTYGVAAALLAAGAALIGVRRRQMDLATRRRLGSARTWLRIHLYGGTLFLLLVLMHSGFRLPTGWVTGWLWALSLWTVASGFVGLALQRWVPKVLASGLGTEVLYERIPELVAELGERAREVGLGSGEAVRDVYERLLAPRFAAPERRVAFFFDVSSGGRGPERELAYLQSLLGEEERARLGELARLYRAKLEIDAHYTLQWTLKGWLYAHAPVSLLLLGFLLVHIFSVLYY